MKKVNTKGVGAHRGARAEMAKTIASEITGDEQAVALFSKEDRGQNMWLIKPQGKPWVVPQGATVTCPVSKEKFGAGEHVMKL